MSRLPDSWATSALLDVSKFVRGVTYRKEVARDRPADGYVPILRANNIVERRLDLTELVYVPASAVSESQMVRRGDVVVATSSGSISVVGKASQVHADLGAGFGAFCGVLRPVDWIELRYFGHFFSTPHYRSEVSRLARGVNINNLRRDHFASLSLPVPPLAEQQRIADKLDALLARVDACRGRLSQLPEALGRLRQAALTAAVSGVLTSDWRAKRGLSAARRRMQGLPDIPSEWSWAVGGDIVEQGAKIIYGIIQPGPKLAAGIPYVRGTDIQDGKILEGQLLRTSKEIASRYERSSLKGGDVLLGIIRATKVAIVPASLEGGNITQGTARFRPSARITSQYLAWVLESPFAQRWLHAHYRGIDMPGLNLADVRQVPIPLPPRDEQEEIARRLKRILACHERLSSRYLAGIQRLERVTPSVLAKAFRGELVPQDTNHEPIGKERTSRGRPRIAKR